MSSPIPTPHLPSGSLFSASAENTINASADRIFQTLIDISTYSAWSTFVPTASVVSQPSGIDTTSTKLHKGTVVHFTAHMTKTFKSPVTLEMVDVSEPPKQDDPPGTKYMVSWMGKGMPGFVLRSERVNEIIKTEDENVCRYKSYETFAGPAAYAVRWKFGQTLNERFGDWARDLKEHCEKGAEARASSAA